MINHRIISSSFVSITAATLLASTASSANAFSVFYGEDYQLTESGGASNYSRVSSTPNSTAANSNFLSNLINPSTENFEGFTPGAVTSFSLNLGSAGTATFQGDGNIENVPNGVFGEGFYPISGNQFLFIGNSIDPRVFPGLTSNSITFSKPVAAIGFYVTGLKNLINQTYLQLTQINGVIKQFTIPESDLDYSSALYYGVIAQDQSEQFTQVRVTGTSSRISGLGVDDLTIASLDQVKSSTPVPEPLTILGSLTAAALGLVFRRKYKQA